RIRADDRVRVANGHRSELDGLAVRQSQHLRSLHGHLADVRLHVEAAEHPRRDDAGPDPYGHLVEAGEKRMPARRDPRPVAGELRLRAVRVPDHDLNLAPVAHRDLEDAVGADAAVVVAECTDGLGLELPAEDRALDDQIVVAEAVPLLERDRHAPTLAA